jgi:hypothetical protein
MGAMTRATGTRKVIQLVSFAGASIISLILTTLLLGLRRFSRLVRRDVEALTGRRPYPKEPSEREPQHARTLDRYSHWIPSMGRHAADDMDEALG